MNDAVVVNESVGRSALLSVGCDEPVEAVADALDVAADLGFHGLDAVELLNAANERVQLEFHAFAVKIFVKVEDIRFDRHVVVVVDGGACPDVREPLVPETVDADERAVDAVFRQLQKRRDGHVRGRHPDGAAELVAEHDFPAVKVCVAEHGVRIVDLARSERRHDAFGRDGPIVPSDGRHGDEVDRITFRQLLQERFVAGALTAEHDVVAGDDDLRAQLVAQDHLVEADGIELGKLRVIREHQHEVDAEAIDHRVALGNRVETLSRAAVQARDQAGDDGRNARVARDADELFQERFMAAMHAVKAAERHRGARPQKTRLCHVTFLPRPRSRFDDASSRSTG
jgi:hypothetical protein